MILSAFLGLFVVLAGVKCEPVSVAAVPSTMTRCSTLQLAEDSISDFYPISESDIVNGTLTFKFQVKAQRDAYVVFYPHNSVEESENYYMVLLGNWDNEMSFLTKYRKGDPFSATGGFDLAKALTTNVLSPSESRIFIIKVTEAGAWTVSGQNNNVYLRAQDTKLESIRFFRLGSWKENSPVHISNNDVATWVFNCTEENREENKSCECGKKEKDSAYLKYSLGQRKALGPPERAIIRTEEITEKILAMNDIQRELFVTVNLKLNWIDARLAWDPTKEFWGITNITLSNPDDIWTPQIYAFKDISLNGTSEPINTFRKSSLLLTNTGQVSSETQLTLSIPCKDPDTDTGTGTGTGTASKKGNRLLCQISLGDIGSTVPLLVLPQHNLHQRNLSTKWTLVESSMSHELVPDASGLACYTILYQVRLEAAPPLPGEGCPTQPSPPPCPRRCPRHAVPVQRENGRNTFVN